MYNRLTQKDWKDKCAGYPWNVHPVRDIDDLPYYKRLAEYEDKIDSHKMLQISDDSEELPLYSGDTIYEIINVDGVMNIISYVVSDKVTIFDGKFCFYAENCDNRDMPFGIHIALEEIGETIFKTKEEANNKIDELVREEQERE